MSDAAQVQFYAIDICHIPCKNGTMRTKVRTRIRIDRAGRVVLPKRLRDSLRLTPGTTLELDSEGERIILRPLRPQAALTKECGIWVFQGPMADASIPDLLDQARDERLRELES